MTGPEPGAGHVIGAAVVKLFSDYQDALAAAGGEHSFTVLHLGSEWCELAAKTCELIMVEAVKHGGRVEFESAAKLPGPGTWHLLCADCSSPLFYIVTADEGQTTYRECARCGERPAGDAR